MTLLYHKPHGTVFFLLYMFVSVIYVSSLYISSLYLKHNKIRVEKFYETDAVIKMDQFLKKEKKNIFVDSTYSYYLIIVCDKWMMG